MLMEGPGEGAGFYDCTFHKSIFLFDSRNFLKLFNIEVVQLSVVPRGTKAHWVNPSLFF